MILVDSRTGSRELLDSLRKLGVDAEIAGKLDADFQFTGNGPDGDVLVGVERKALESDLLKCVRDRRLAGSQIAPMQLAYDVRYIVVEGVWRRQRGTGMLEVLNGKWREPRGRFHYAEVDRFLCSLEELGDLRVWRTADEEETCAAIADRYLWWQKEWDEHRTDRAVYAPPPDRPKKGSRARLFHADPSLLQCWLAQLPRVDERAWDLAKYFESAGDMAAAGVVEWTKIPGIGRKTAEGIVGAIWKTKST